MEEGSCHGDPADDDAAAAAAADDDDETTDNDGPPGTDTATSWALHCLRCTVELYLNIRLYRFLSWLCWDTLLRCWHEGSRK